MRNLESKLQQSCVKWFRLQYPDHANLLFAIPNGGHRNIITAKRLKAEGVLPGVADLFLAVPVSKPLLTPKGLDYFPMHGLFIEMKYGKGKQTESQIRFMYAVQERSYEYVVCNSFESFQDAVRNYLK